MSDTLKDPWKREPSLAERLRALSDEAALRREEERKKKDEEDRLEANQIIATIEEQAIEQAKEGKDHLVVMAVSYSDSPKFTGDSGFTIDPEKLTGPSRLVYEHCRSEDLNPTLVCRWVSIKKNIHRIDFKLMIRW